MKLQEVHEVQKGMTHDRSFRRAVEGRVLSGVPCANGIGKGSVEGNLKPNGD
jgi:hypothetical protein